MSYGYRLRTSSRPISRSNARRFLKRIENELHEMIKHAPSVDEQLKVKEHVNLTQYLNTMFQELFNASRDFKD